MATYQVFKETALPATLQPHSIYLIAPAGRPGFVEMYVTGASAATVKRIIDHSTVQAMIDAAVAAGSGGAVIVDDIAARNALTPVNAQTVYVVNASGDPTVASGGATYIWRASTSTWIKQSEAESLDLSLTWAALTGKPSSTPADIDDAAAKRHTHANATELGKIGESGGMLTYAGALPHIGWDSTGW